MVSRQNHDIFVAVSLCFSTTKSNSQGSGLNVGNGGLLTIDGDATTIHDNCTGGIRQTYGLDTGSIGTASGATHGLYVSVLDEDHHLLSYT